MAPDRAVGVQLRKGVLEYCVLAMLQNQPSYGFELVRSLGEVELVTSEGTIYPLLTRLRKDGYVTTTWRESEDGPPRKYYETTPEGDAVLDLFRAEWGRFSSAVDSVLIKGDTT